MKKRRAQTIAVSLLTLFSLASCAGASTSATSMPPPGTPVPTPAPAATPIPPTATPAPSPVPPTPVPTALPALTGSGGGIIAFVSSRSGNQDLYLMNADGSGLRQLTDSPADEGWASWSPDGTRIVYHSNQAGRSTLRIVEVATGTSRQLAVGVGGNKWEPAWSHDGQWIAFSNQPAGGTGDIYIVHPDGAGLLRLTKKQAMDGAPVWSPDDRQIAFVSERDGNFEVYAMDSSGGNPLRLTDDPGEDIVSDWSPDGSEIAFFSNRDGRYQLYLIHPDGSDLLRLAGAPGEESYATWSPDGSRIAYSSGSGTELDIYVMNADGTGVQRLTDSPGQDWAPVWRPEPDSGPPPPVGDGVPAPGATWTRPGDGMVMVYVPAGEFQMGSDYRAVRDARQLCTRYAGDLALAVCGQAAFADESPAHRVALDGFWVDRTEVTNGQYRRCVQAGRCAPPQESGSSARDAYYGDSAYDEYPVVWVSHQQAESYCEWAGARLPTEAEWEYAARGPRGWLFPWGDTFDGRRLNYCDVNCTAGLTDAAVDDGYADTAPVGSFPDGASWCGALDVAGNVREWVADWYATYPAERQVNPTGPATGNGYGTRGGSWLDTPDDVRSTNRGGNSVDYAHPKVGFRCAQRAGR